MFDISAVIKSKEVSDYLKSINYQFYNVDLISLIHFSFNTIKEKLDLIKQLDQHDKDVQQAQKFYEKMIKYIYDPDKPCVYHCDEYEIKIPETWKNEYDVDNLNFSYGVYSFDDAVKECSFEVCKNKSRYAFIQEYIPNGDSYIWLEFDMYPIDGRLEPVYAYTDAIDTDFINKININFPYPYKNGEQLKVELPISDHPIYGHMISEYDTIDWYHWFGPLNDELEIGIGRDVALRFNNIKKWLNWYDWISLVNKEV